MMDNDPGSLAAPGSFLFRAKTGQKVIYVNTVMLKAMEIYVLTRIISV